MPFPPEKDLPAAAFRGASRRIRRLWPAAALLLALAAAPLPAGAAEPQAKPALPAAGWIVFDSRRNGQFDIWKMRPDGSGAVQLTDSPDWETSPDWSPDGATIVYNRKEPESDDVNASIWIMDADGSWPRMLVRRGTAPRFTPDGTGVVFDRDRTSLHRYDLRTRKVEQFVPPPGAPVFSNLMVKPQVSPDGRTVAFISDRGGKWHNWVMDLEGALTLVGAGCQPTWSLDGKRIFYITDTSYGENAVWVFDWPGGPPRHFLTLEGTWRHVYFPSVSDDGRWLLFSACPYNEHDHSMANYQIFICPLAGGEPVRLSRNSHTERWPKLSTRAR